MIAHQSSHKHRKNFFSSISIDQTKTTNYRERHLATTFFSKYNDNIIFYYMTIYRPDKLEKNMFIYQNKVHTIFHILYDVKS